MPNMPDGNPVPPYDPGLGPGFNAGFMAGFEQAQRGTEKLVTSIMLQLRVFRIEIPDEVTRRTSDWELHAIRDDMNQVGVLAISRHNEQTSTASEDQPL